MDARCATTAPLVRRFLARGLPPAQRERLRAHLERCGHCRREYEGSVEAVACVGRSRRAARGRLERALRHELLRPGRLAQELELARGRRRSHALRPMVYAALAATLLMLLARPGGPGATELVPVVGAVEAGTRRLEAPGPLRQGERVATDAAGRARFVGRGLRVELGPDTRLLVERTRRLRLRLFRGALEARGAVTVVATGAAVEVGAGGEARVEIAGDGLRVAARATSVRLVTNEGARELAPGELASVPRP